MYKKIEELVCYYFADKVKKGQTVTFEEVRRCCREFGVNLSAVENAMNPYVYIEVGVEFANKGVMSGLSVEHARYVPIRTPMHHGKCLTYKGDDGEEVARFLEISGFIQPRRVVKKKFDVKVYHLAKEYSDAFLEDMFICNGTPREILLRAVGEKSDFFFGYEVYKRYIRYYDTSKTYRLTAKGRWYVINRIFKDGSWLRIYRKNGLWRFIKMIFGLNK